MPSDAKTRGLDAGTKAEVRAAQAWFWDGYYVRRGVDLYHRFGSETSSVTDLDLLGFSLDASLATRKQIGEVKTGTSKTTPRPLDRALWLHGLRALVGAERSEITTALPVTPAIRDACHRLGTVVQRFADLDERERRLHIEQVRDVGSQGESMALLREEVRGYAKSDATLDRAYWFLVSEVWFLEPFDALKRTLGVIRELGRLWPPEGDMEAGRVARWFFAEAVSVATLQLALVAGEANTMDAHTFQAMASARLATGDIPFHSMRKLAERVDEYVAKLLTSLDAPAEIRTSAMGAFVPVPPEYTEPLLELVSRLAGEPAAVAKLPRQLDAVVFERLVRRRELTPEIRLRMGLTTSTERLARLIAAFLRGQFGLPQTVDRVLSAPMVSDGAPGAQEEPMSLFEGPPVE